MRPDTKPMNCICTGYSSFSADAIIQHVRDGGKVSDLPGDFVCAGDGILVTSAVSAYPYFYYHCENSGQFVHGANLFDVVTQAKIPWSWNQRAMNSLFCLGHLVGSDTLHKFVHRIPAASIVYFGNKQLKIVTTDFWNTLFNNNYNLNPEIALNKYNKAMSSCVDSSKSLTVSLSAGRDSRAILAWTLGQGIKPRTITMGYSNSEDLIEAKAISRKFNLEHTTIELKKEEYHIHAERIIDLTGGSKTAANWHTHIYPHKAGLNARDIHLVGSNGEFARTYYIPKKWQPTITQVSQLPLTNLFMWLKFGPRKYRKLRVSRIPIKGGNPDETFPKLVTHLTDLCIGSNDFLNRLDIFYTKERVRHFIGNGLALYNDYCDTRSPFLDAQWIKSIAQLPRHWKISSRFHEYIINNNFPKLGPQISHDKNKIGYSPFMDLINESKTKELLLDSIELKYIFERSFLNQAVSSGPDMKEILLTLHYLVKVIRQKGIILKN